MDHSKDILKRIILLDNECQNSVEYASDNQTLLLIINDIAKSARKIIGDGKEKFTFFLKGPFSQWIHSPFEVKQIKYNCAEQYMMAKKAILFGDTLMYTKIMSTNHPKLQKEYGREVKNFKKDVWDDYARKIVYNGNYAKFTQNEKLKTELLKTDGTTLVEVNPQDSIWGIGLMEGDFLTLKRSTWKGKNWLGEVLTKVREDIIYTKKLEDYKYSV